MSDGKPLVDGLDVPELSDIADLAVAAIIVLWVSVVSPDFSSLNLLHAFTGLVGLLFVPGYLTILSVLTVTKPEAKIDHLEMLLLSFIISITIIPIVGMGLHFITGNANPETIVDLISGYVAVSVLAHFVYRFTSDSYYGIRVVDVRGFLNTLFQRETRVDTALNIAILLLIFIGAVAVNVPVPGQSSAQFTELGLLAHNESGDFAMEGYLSDLNSTGSQTIYAGVTNRERQAVNYILVVQIQRTELREQSVAVLERRQAVRTNIRLDHDEDTRIPYRVSSKEAQTGCRVAFLLYKGDIPESATMDNSYREVHLWHMNDPPAEKNSCRDINDISVQQKSSTNGA